MSIGWAAGLLALAAFARAEPPALSVVEAREVFTRHVARYFHGDVSVAEFREPSGMNMYEIATPLDTQPFEVYFRLRCEKPADLSLFASGYALEKTDAGERLVAARAPRAKTACAAGRTALFKGVVFFEKSGKDWIVRSVAHEPLTRAEKAADAQTKPKG